MFTFTILSCIVLILTTINISVTASYHPISNTGAVLDLHGNLLPLGIFYTTIEIGTPAQSFQVTVDTGSTDLLVPIAGCTGCKKNTTLYVPSQSATTAIEICNKTLKCSKCQPNGEDSQCSFLDSYLTCDLSNLTAICSVEGGIYRDTLTIGSLKATNVRFGGIDKQTTNFDQFQQIDGIMGLAYFGDTRGSPMGFDVTPFQRLVNQNDGLEDVIQMCLTTNGGLLIFGQDEEIDQQYYTGKLRWTPITLEAWYVVNATGLLVNNLNMNISLLELNGPFPSDPCIVDSGTNFLSLREPAFNAVVDEFYNLCNVSYLVGICDVSFNQSLFNGVEYALSEAELANFPNVEIDLVDNDDPHGSIKLPIDPVDYFVRLDNGKYRLGITMGDCIIGNTHMLKYWTVYDRGNKRLGFAEAIKNKCVAKRANLLYK